jgi:hypothetical protein
MPLCARFKKAVPFHAMRCASRSLLRRLAVAAAAIVLLCLVLLVTLACEGLVRHSEYYAKYATVRAPRALLSALYPKLGTGDLVLFVAAASSGTNSAATRCFYSHAAVLLREGPLVYASETQGGAGLMPDPADPARDLYLSRGATLVPLLTRLKYYAGSCYLLRLTPPLGPAQAEALKRSAERLCAARHPYPSAAQVVLGLFGWPSVARHCFQHAAHLLDQTGLAPLDRRGRPLEAEGFLGVCEEVASLPGRALPGGRRYLPPVQILYDISG